MAKVQAKAQQKPAPKAAPKVAPKVAPNAAKKADAKVDPKAAPKASPKAEDKPKAERKSNAAGVAKSWTIPEVAAQRKLRHHVIVDGKMEYTSVAQAFRSLDLPLSRHIPFRKRLKLEGKLKNEFGHDWEAVLIPPKAASKKQPAAK